MDTVRRIRELGFRRWYQRRLNEAHLSLVTCLLCMITAAICLEVMVDQSGLDAKILLVTLVAGATGIAVSAWRRFQLALVFAESFAGQATCRRCGAYAKWDVTASGGEAAGASGPWLRVRCRQCGEQWRIE